MSDEKKESNLPIGESKKLLESLSKFSQTRRISNICLLESLKSPIQLKGVKVDPQQTPLERGGSWNSTSTPVFGGASTRYTNSIFFNFDLDKSPNITENYGLKLPKSNGITINRMDSSNFFQKNFSNNSFLLNKNNNESLKTLTASSFQSIIQNKNDPFNLYSDLFSKNMCEKNDLSEKIKLLEELNKRTLECFKVNFEEKIQTNSTHNKLSECSTEQLLKQLKPFHQKSARKRKIIKYKF